MVNEGKEVAKLFYDIEALPTVNGKGRFLGMSAALLTDSAYNKTWWVEGEQKMFYEWRETISGLCWIGYGRLYWQCVVFGSFNNLYQGCTVASEETREFEFYRFHILDPIFCQIRVLRQANWRGLASSSGNY